MPPTAQPSFFFNDTATTEIYTLSLHDALPILLLFLSPRHDHGIRRTGAPARLVTLRRLAPRGHREVARSEEHTSELQSQSNLVCRLLLEIRQRVQLSRRAVGRHAAKTDRTTEQ